jgi:hypothetical protein
MGVDMSNNRSTYILGGIILLALTAMVSWPIGAATATTDEPKNGWGEATSERATEQGDVGEHSSDPDQDGTKGNDNQEDDDNNHRSGIGNVADALTDQKNPDELGELLDCADEFVDEGEGGSLEACS